MRRKPRKILVLGLLATSAVAGCTLNRNALRKNGDTVLGQLGLGGGKVIEPKRCMLTVTILGRPLNDKVVNESVWSLADGQAVPDAARRAFEANGLRLGVLTGGLPAEVEAAVNAPPPDKVESANYNTPDGSSSLISLAETTPSVSLLLNRDGRAFGKDYQEASGFLRVTATQVGASSVALRFVPELHHGPIQRHFDQLPNGTTVTPNTMQFMLKDGQQEETLRELAAGLTLEPGQVAVVGCRPDRKGSLGHYLFTLPESNSDRLLQRVVLIRASRTNAGVPGSQPAPAPASRLEPEEPPPDIPAAANAKKLDPNQDATPVKTSAPPDGK